MPDYGIPLSTYRLQFNGSFRFKAGRALLSYLQDLGITDLYASPLFRARRGSRHGYSVTNPMELNPELGSEADFSALTNGLKARRMGLLFDIVPNHMALSHDNPWWMDVLENGPCSLYALFFDIDWRPTAGVPGGQVLLAILGKPYGDVLESGELRLSLEEGGFFVNYFDHKFPLDPKTYGLVLSHRLDRLEEELGEGHAALIGIRGLLTLLDHLPGRELMGRKKVLERQRDKEIIKKSLWLLYRGTPEARRYLDESLSSFNGTRGDPGSYDLLDRLLVEQPYRLAFWKVTLETINYRRFFSINDLIGIRIEEPAVFEAFEPGLLFRLVEQGRITGIRVDHIDGLYDPQGYLLRMRERLAAKAKAAGRGDRFYVVVEKILAEGETLPPEWPVEGTTGYDFLNVVNGLFVDEQGYRELRKVYRSFTGLRLPAADVVYRQKKLLMETLFGGEVENLGHALNLAASHDRHARDISRRDLTAELVEIIACLPVYRTYIRGFAVEAQDRAWLEKAIAEACRRGVPAGSPALGFIRRLLLLEFPSCLSAGQKDDWLRFVMRWQQFTGPVMAKGLEDSALYVYNPLISLNEVGTNFRPVSPASFHEFNRDRLRSRPFSMNATSTHDTKRSEDVRARINVLSEMPGEWKEALERWKGLNRPHKTIVDGRAVPDPNEEIFLYQTLIGAWPLLSGDLEAFGQRLRDYTVKAAREAGVHTRWITPGEEHEKGLCTFLAAILDRSCSKEFLDDFLAFQSRLAFRGAMSSLGQVLLKIASPGVPDFYQGTELYDFSLVDPDNRRPVDFQARKSLLADLKRREQGPIEGLKRFDQGSSEGPRRKGQGSPEGPMHRRLGSPERLKHFDPDPLNGLLRDLLAHWEDGRIKLYTIRKALNFRKEHPDLFLEGDYLPLHAIGPRAGNIVAFARQQGDRWAVAAVPRFMEAIAGPMEPPLGAAIWGKSVLALPPGAPHRWTDVFTNAILNCTKRGQALVLPLHLVFARFPVALLSGVAGG